MPKYLCSGSARVPPSSPSSSLTLDLTLTSPGSLSSKPLLPWL